MGIQPTIQSIDPSKAAAVPCLVVDDNQVLTTLSLAHLIQLVPNPTQFEDKRLQPSVYANPALADLADKRETVQRYFTGAKRTNVPKYADFIHDRVSNMRHRGTPPICLGVTTKLTVVPGPEGTSKVAIPFGRLFLAVDGETQRAAWEQVHHRVYEEVQAGLADEDILENVRIPVEIHHGISVDALQALFYERNVLGAKVNANEAIAKDQTDPATRIVRAIMNMPLHLQNGQRIPTSSIVQQASRQVGRKSPHWVTLSALRTLVVTTMLGRSGLQYGAKPVPMPDSADFQQVSEEVAGVVHGILQRYASQFAAKESTLIGAPAIMAGIGVVAHRALTTMPNLSGKERITRDELLQLLDEVRWEKEGDRWDGIGTRKTPKGVTTVAGPKEVGYAVAAAIENADPETGAKIRGRTYIPDESALFVNAE